MELKKITAIVRRFQLEEIEKALREIPVGGMSVTQVMGFGEYKDFYREDWEVGHARIEIFAEASHVDAIVRTIIEAGRTGAPGDGLIAVLPVERIYRIRTRAPIVAGEI